MKKQPLKHSHFLQRAYQRRFATSDGYIWVFAKKHHTVQQLHVDVVCAQSGFYRYEDEEGGIQDFEDDQWLHTLERAAPQLLQSATDAMLTSAGREQLATYLALSALRTPSYQVCALKTTITAAFPLQDGEPHGYSDTFRLCRQRDPKTATTAFDVTRREMTMNPAEHIHNLRTQAPLIGSILASLTWRVLRSNDSAFLTTDTPVTIVLPPGTPVRYLCDPAEDCGERYLFPLDRQSCLLLKHGPVGTDALTVTNDIVAEINGHALNNAYEYVLSPTPDLDSILPTQLRWTRETPPRRTGNPELVRNDPER